MCLSLHLTVYVCHHQRAMSKWWGVYMYTRVTHLRNCLHTGCALSWSIPVSCVIIPTLVTTICGENTIWPFRPYVQAYTPYCRRTPSIINKLVQCHPIWRICKSQSVLLTAESNFFTWAEVLNMSGMRWSADFFTSISSLKEPTNVQWLNRDLMQVWIVIRHDFHTGAIGTIGRICSAVTNAQGGHTWYWFCDFNTGKSFSATSRNTKVWGFFKFQV